MTKAWVGQHWNDVKQGMCAILGTVDAEWPGDAPRPGSPRPRAILACDGTVKRVEMPRSPRFAFEASLGSGNAVMRTPAEVVALSAPVDARKPRLRGY